MNRSIPLFLASCIAVAAFSTAAAPPKRSDLSDNPVWVLHIDCDALRQTYIGKFLLYQMDKPEMKSNMVAFQSVFSFDLRTQLHGLTVYSDGSSPMDGIVILYADFDPDHIIKLVKGAEAAEVTTNNQHVIYSWIERRKNPNDEAGSRNYAAIQKGLMVTGKDKERVSAALAVIDGTAPNLSASKAFPELAATGSATIVQASARKLDFLGSDPNMALLNLSKRLKFLASEAEEQFNAVLTMELGDEATAKQMSIVAQGLVALLSLQKDNPKAARLAGGISFKQDGGTLTATLSVPSADIIAALKAHLVEKEMKRAKTK